MKDEKIRVIIQLLNTTLGSNISATKADQVVGAVVILMEAELNNTNSRGTEMCRQP